MGGTNGHGPPAGRGTPQKPPQGRLDARIAFIQALVAAGETATNIVRRVEQVTKKEVAERKLALGKQDALARAGDEEGAAKIEVPPIIWSSNNGDMGAGDPPALRTLERYMAVARENLRAVAQENAKQGDLLMGRQLTRLDFIYVQSISAGKYLTALEVVKEMNRLHGLHGAIRMELSGPQGKPIQHQDATPIAQTEAQALAALRTLLKDGAQRAGVTLPATALLAASSEGAEEVESELLAETNDDEEAE